MVIDPWEITKRPSVLSPGPANTPWYQASNKTAPVTRMTAGKKVSTTSRHGFSEGNISADALLANRTVGATQMETLLAVLCNSAADYRGHLCILGCFDTLSSESFPFHHHHCSIALRLLFRQGDLGTHRIDAILIDSDGRTILPDRGPHIEITIDHIPEDSFFLSQNIIFAINGLPMPHPGVYSFDIHFDGTIITRIPLQAVLLT